ncbi:glycosyltransferase family 2 protein [Novosphingobium huizhouense]|uniref:glycosyltransferase family 2 protein n=1 Tax=Novosphingobium huizhouense TaxID=2866625 RepID=UPI001CD856D5|nr:glycosyltransferase family 2 protein [Novosphingobium huizhouense]
MTIARLPEAALAPSSPIAVCIVAFRDSAIVAQCLASLERSSFADFEVVICENGGPEAFARLEAALPARLPGGQGVTCLMAPGNLGYAGGVNFAIRARPGARAWFVLNPDATVAPDALGELVARLERGDCDAVGGVLHYPSGKVQAYGGRWRGWLARAESIGQGRSVEEIADEAGVEREMNYLLGAAMLIDRSFVARAGLMQEDYFLYAEEIEWCLRALRSGARLGFAPSARICHGQGATTGSADPIRSRPKLPIFLDERNKLLVVRDTTPARLPVAIPLAAALAFLRFARRGARRQFAYALQGWWDGARNRRGVPAWLR